MIQALFAKSFRDGRLLLAALAIFLFCFAWLQIWVGSMISVPAFTQFLTNALPQQFERLSGVPFSEMATPAGRIAVVYVHPLVLFSALAWSLTRGSDCVSGEIGRGTMELLLAQPIRRSAVFITQAAVTLVGAALLAAAVWCGTAIGLATVGQPEGVSSSLYVAPAVNLFTRTVCTAGVSALMSSWDSHRWRTIGLVIAWYVLSMILEILGRMSESWHWVIYLSFMTAYKPQQVVAHPAGAWSLFSYQEGAIAGFGYGGCQLVLLALGLLAYVAGAIIFSRRELPAPL
jgi:ABC-2 type transport system permease protein